MNDSCMEMKKTLFFLTVTALLLVSCKQQRDEKKYVKGILSEDYETSFQALDDFCDWLKSDSSTMSYDFSYAREKLGMKVNTSSDGLVRSYSWITNKGEVTNSYANVLQWKSEGKMMGYSGPLDVLLTGRKPTIKRQWSLAHSIDTIFDIQDAELPIYMFVESYVNENGKSFTYVSAAVIHDIKISVLAFFFNGIETAGNRAYVDDGKVNKAELIKWDPAAKKLYAYVTDDNEHVIPGQYEEYILGPTQFTKVEKEQ